MRIVLAPDSFKESISAVEICRAVARVLTSLGHDVVSVPLADGGEGTVDAVLAAAAGERIECLVDDPLGNTVKASYALVKEGRTAVVEMAAASGLQLIAPGRRDPLRASTFGTGQLIRHAIERGATQVIVGLGGSATTDAGAGAAQALGVLLLTADGAPIARGGEALASLDRVDCAGNAGGRPGIELIAACDVTNPLTGPYGAAQIYGPQKGASPDQVQLLEDALVRFARIVRRDTGAETANLPGAGAAGGLAAGLVALCGARIESGFATIAAITGLEGKIAQADCVVTGEGKLDAQTLHGKTVAGVCGLAKQHGVPICAIAGILDGIDPGFPVYELAGIAGDCEESRRNPIPYLEAAARKLAADLRPRR